VRPRGRGKDDWIAKDENGSGNLTVRGQVQSATVDYDTGVVDVTFSASQEGNNFEVCYYPDRYIDVDNLVFFPNRSPYLLNLRLPADYNALKSAGKRGFYFNDGPEPDNSPDGYSFIDAQLLGLNQALLMQALVHCVAEQKGYYPGVVIFTARALDNYSALWDPGGVRGGKSFGNGVFVFRQPGFSSEYFQSLVLHEMSHSFYFHHAPGGGASGAKPELHDPDDVCVMSYSENDGDYCGQCIAALRGINTGCSPPFPPRPQPAVQAQAPPVVQAQAPPVPDDDADPEDSS
jgi:hypothetical protein